MYYGFCFDAFFPKTLYDKKNSQMKLLIIIGTTSRDIFNYVSFKYCFIKFILKKSTINIQVDYL